MRPITKVLRSGEFAENAVRYHVIASVAVSLATLVLIPVLPVVVPIVWVYYRRYFASLEVVLTSRDLHVKRGVMNRREQSVPLEKITDLAIFQGPIMRRMGLKGLQVETAGSPSQATALVRIVGLVDTDGFRDAVLEQRDRIAEGRTEITASDLPLGRTGPGERAPRVTTSEEMLREIHQTLLRIEGAIGNRTE
jgi:putative membrane protein